MRHQKRWLRQTICCFQSWLKFARDVKRHLVRQQCSNAKVSLIQTGTRADSSVSAGTERSNYRGRSNISDCSAGFSYCFISKLGLVVQRKTSLINKRLPFYLRREVFLCLFFPRVAHFAIHPSDSAGWIWYSRLCVSLRGEDLGQ